MDVTCNVADVRCTIWQLQQGGWGKEADKQSVCCTCNNNPTPLVWIWYPTKEPPGLHGTKQQQKALTT